MRIAIGGLLLAAIALAQIQVQPPRAPALNMQEIAQALGVTCEFCHSAERGSNQPEPKKDIARQMIDMTRDLNARVQSASGKPAAEATRVQCVTCHRGVAIPGQLTDILLRTAEEKGGDAAVAQYRDLRARYYGRQSYDFCEDTLILAAQQRQARKPDDSIALLKLNIEFSPRSARSYAALGYAYTRKFDDATAITYLEKALEIEPDNGTIQGQLIQLKSYQRRK